MRWSAVFSLLVAAIAAIATCICLPDLSGGEAPKPPAQPATGPGGSSYKHAAVTKSVHGEDATQYWLFEPAEPAPESAPLVVFNHGWGGTNPRIYGAWIEHLVRRGNIVVFPRYQSSLRTPAREFAPNAIQSVKDAIKLLDEKGHVKPQLDNFAIVGHSAGAQTTANMAALAGSVGLPQPKAVMCVQPGKSWSLAKRIAIPLEDMSKILSATLLLTVIGDNDKIVKDVDAKKIFLESANVPAANKEFVTLVSDDHGEPKLEATHFAPCAANKDYDSGEAEQTRIQPGKEDREEEGFLSIGAASQTLDALDFYGLWKLFDGLCDAAFYSKNREYALDNTPEQRFMGEWSDGTPVKELVVTDKP